MKYRATLAKIAWRGGFGALVATCLEDMVADHVPWLPNLSMNLRLDLIALCCGAIMWGGWAEFRAKAIVPVQQAFAYGWRLRGEEDEAKRREEEAQVVHLRSVSALRASSGGYPTVPLPVPRTRTARHRPDASAPRR